jgi:hypothetical protein
MPQAAIGNYLLPPHFARCVREEKWGQTINLFSDSAKMGTDNNYTSQNHPTHITETAKK